MLCKAPVQEALILQTVNLMFPVLVTLYHHVLPFDLKALSLQPLTAKLALARGSRDREEIKRLTEVQLYKGF